MFSIDRWQEILDTVRRNKLRTVLTSLSVAWGIFMLVILLGAGTGLQNRTEHNFRDDAVNSIWLYPGKTSKPYKGTNPGRQIRFRDADFEALRDTLAGVEHITGRFYVRGDFTVNYGDKRSSFDIRSVHPAHKYLEKTLIAEGRFLNELDLENRRKVAVIGMEVAEFLFPDGVEPIGEEIEIGGLSYTVVGVFEDAGGRGELRKIYIPITTAQMAYGGSDQVHRIMFTVGDASAEESVRIARDTLELLSRRHTFSPDDPRAVRVRNNVENFQRMTEVFRWIRVFIWIVGIGTIVAGIVGVSNIMLISVKERTREIGVRKALGATPGSIVGLVMQEAVLVTAVSGYFGLVAGVGLLELVAANLPDNDYIRNPQVDFGIAVGATLLLVFFGAVAGFFPARRAAKVNPIEALRDE